MDMPQSRDQWIKALSPMMGEIIDLRRHFHQYPELSGQEKQTKERVMEELRRLGIPVREFQESYGVMGILSNGEGPCIALRADMDALPIQETVSLPYASCRPGIMHACGHDVHTAILLGTARYLSAHPDQWRGTVKLLFEPAEETIGGARAMTAQGCLHDPEVDYVIGQHVNPRYPAGTFFAKGGPVSGASDMICLKVFGTRAHGAYPEAGVDAIVIASQIITALQTLVSRNISPLESSVLTFGTIQGGTAGNVICGEVTLEGTLRTLSPAIRSQLLDRLRTLPALMAQSMGGRAEITLTPGYPPVINDETTYPLLEETAARLLGSEHVIRRTHPSLGVDSFGYFMDGVPGIYYDIGSGVGTALHTDTFQVDEDCLMAGIMLQCAFVHAMAQHLSGTDT